MQNLESFDFVLLLITRETFEVPLFCFWNLGTFFFLKISKLFSQFRFCPELVYLQVKMVFGIYLLSLEF